MTKHVRTGSCDIPLHEKPNLGEFQVFIYVENDKERANHAYPQKAALTRISNGIFVQSGKQNLVNVNDNSLRFEPIFTNCYMRRKLMVLAFKPCIVYSI